MTTDLLARKITINYEGGSLYMTHGALQSLFGDALESLTSTAAETTVTVAKHNRTRVIGGPTIEVEGHSYTYMQWPTSESGFADGGQVVYLAWTGSEGEWTARVTGSLAALGTFLAENTSNNVVFRSERGTNYGPF